MFIITYPFTSSNYKRFYNKSIIIKDDVAKVYYKYNPSTNTYTTPKTSECGADYNYPHNSSIDLIVKRSGYYNRSNNCLAFSTLEEATLAKLHLLNQLAALISSDIAYLQTKLVEACPPELSTAYDSMKLNYPEIFI